MLIECMLILTLIRNGDKPIMRTSLTPGEFVLFDYNIKYFGKFSINTEILHEYINTVII